MGNVTKVVGGTFQSKTGDTSSKTADDATDAAKDIGGSAQESTSEVKSLTADTLKDANRGLEDKTKNVGE